MPLQQCARRAELVQDLVVCQHRAPTLSCVLTELTALLARAGWP